MDHFEHLFMRYFLSLNRGSSSKKHWKDNLNYAKVEVSFEELGLLDLDHLDGLDAPDWSGQSSQTLMTRLATLSNFVTRRNGNGGTGNND